MTAVAAATSEAGETHTRPSHANGLLVGATARVLVQTVALGVENPTLFEARIE
jgi:hypothetical protein